MFAASSVGAPDHTFKTCLIRGCGCSSVGKVSAYGAGGPEFIAQRHLDRCGGKLVTLALRRREIHEFKFILDYIEHSKTA